MFKIKKSIKRIMNPVSFDNLSSLKPISKTFGLDRGTPIDRYYIEKFLYQNKELVKGKILEIADNTYSRKFSDESLCTFEILNYMPNSTATIVGDLTDKNTLPESKIDCFICTQTFNFIYDVKSAIAGSYHLLNKDHGILLATVSGASQISRYDMDRWGDFWRFTDKSVRIMFEEVFGKNHVEIITYGNVLAAISLLQGIAVEDLPDVSLLDSVDGDYPILLGIVAKC